MTGKINYWRIISYVVGLFVFAIGALNLVLVHPVPGIVFLLLSLLYLPQANNIFSKMFGFAIPPAATIILALIIIWFTLGVSDLGDIWDKF